MIWMSEGDVYLVLEGGARCACSSAAVVTDDCDKLNVVLRSLWLSCDDVIIHGAAPGADTLAGQWAADKGIPVEAFPADWEKHGRAAGPIRNKQMLDDGKPDLVVAFPGGWGTANMCKQAREAGVRVLEA
jgi:hypothetical protein